LTAGGEGQHRGRLEGRRRPDAAVEGAREGHEAVVRLLVEQDDIEADSKDEDGMMPLSLALEQGHEAVFRLLETKLSNWRVG
jgi:hypothetical protein